jgi:starch synthase
VRALFAVSEVAPWVKTGGLGDVAAALPGALMTAGCDVRVLVPAYPAMMKACGERRALARIDSPGGRFPASTLWEAVLADGLTLWLLESPECFSREGNPYLDAQGHEWSDNPLRFGLLSRVAALLSAPGSPVDWRADVLHCNDWQSALAPAYLRYLHGDEGAASIVTIHNLAFQGIFDAVECAPLGLPERAFALDGVEFHGKLSFLKGGLQCCDLITTVSPTYASEILGPDYGCGLEGLLRFRADRVSGILNGIDTEVWDAARDPALASNYDVRSLGAKAANKLALQKELGLAPDPHRMLFGVVSRLTGQKGLDLLLEIGEALCEEGAQIALLGSGDRAMERGWRDLAAHRPDSCAAVIGFDETLAHRIEGGADAFVMPSRFEPCGLNQMYSLRYGTPPVVRRTGGLADTVIDATPQNLRDGSANGFVFDEASALALHGALRRAIAAFGDPPAWRAIQRAGMRTDFSWSGAAARYLEAYRTAMRLRVA